MNRGPDVKRILVLFDDTLSSRSFFNKQLSLNSNNEIDFMHDVKVEVQLVSNFSHWQRLVRQVGIKYDALVIGGYFFIFDNQGKHVDSDQVIHWTSTHSKRPPYCFWDFCIGKGKGAGGMVLHTWLFNGKTGGRNNQRSNRR